MEQSDLSDNKSIPPGYIVRGGGCPGSGEGDRLLRHASTRHTRHAKGAQEGQRAPGSGKLHIFYRRIGLAALVGCAGRLIDYRSRASFSTAAPRGASLVTEPKQPFSRHNASC